MRHLRHSPTETEASSLHPSAHVYIMSIARVSWYHLVSSGIIWWYLVCMYPSPKANRRRHRTKRGRPPVNPGLWREPPKPGSTHSARTLSLNLVAQSGSTHSARTLAQSVAQVLMSNGGVMCQPRPSVDIATSISPHPASTAIRYSVSVVRVGQQQQHAALARLVRGDTDR